MAYLDIEAEEKRLNNRAALLCSFALLRPPPNPRRLFRVKLLRIPRQESVSVSGSETFALKFERALKIQASAARDLHEIARDCALHGSTARGELLRTQLTPAQSSRPVGSQRAMYRACCGVLIDAD